MAANRKNTKIPDLSTAEDRLYKRYQRFEAAREQTWTQARRWTCSSKKRAETLTQKTPASGKVEQGDAQARAPKAMESGAKRLSEPRNRGIVM